MTTKNNENRFTSISDVMQDTTKSKNEKSSLDWAAHDDDDEGENLWSAEFKQPEPQSINEIQNEQKSEGEWFEKPKEDNQDSRKYRPPQQRENSFQGERRKPESAPFPTQPPYTAKVLNLSYNATEEDLSEFFKELGTKRVSIVKDKERGTSKGFGFVEFEAPEGLKSALEADGYEWIDNRKMTVIVHAVRERRDFNVRDNNRDNRDNNSFRRNKYDFTTRSNYRDNNNRDNRDNRDNNYNRDNRDNRDNNNNNNEGPKERKKLQLQPKTVKPETEGTGSNTPPQQTPSSDSSKISKENPFGNATPTKTKEYAEDDDNKFSDKGPRRKNPDNRDNRSFNNDNRDNRSFNNNDNPEENNDNRSSNNDNRDNRSFNNDNRDNRSFNNDNRRRFDDNRGGKRFDRGFGRSTNQPRESEDRSGFKTRGGPGFTKRGANVRGNKSYSLARNSKPTTEESKANDSKSNNIYDVLRSDKEEKDEESGDN